MLEKSKTESVPCHSSLTLCASFSKVLILFCFDLISPSSNLIWHFLYIWEFLRYQFANLKWRNFGITPFFLFAYLKWRNFGITPFFLQSNKNLRSKWHFCNLKSHFSNLHVYLTLASPYLFLIISAIDFPLGNLIWMINKNTKAIILVRIIVRIIAEKYELFESAISNYAKVTLI